VLHYKGTYRKCGHNLSVSRCRSTQTAKFMVRHGKQTFCSVISISKRPFPVTHSVFQFMEFLLFVCDGEEDLERN